MLDEGKLRHSIPRKFREQVDRTRIFFFRKEGKGRNLPEINSRFIVYVDRWMLITFTSVGTCKLSSRYVEFISQFRLRCVKVTKRLASQWLCKNGGVFLAYSLWPQRSAHHFPLHVLFGTQGEIGQEAVHRTKERRQNQCS